MSEDSKESDNNSERKDEIEHSHDFNVEDELDEDDSIYDDEEVTGEVIEIDDDDEEEVDDSDKLNIVSITLDEIDRKTTWKLVEFFGRMLPVIVSRGSLPMISINQADGFYENGGYIYNTSALPAYDKNFIKLLELKIYYEKLDQQKYETEIEDLDREEPQPNEQVTRLVYGLQDQVGRFRDNINGMIDPEHESTRKGRRLQRKKVLAFQQSGYKQQITVISKYIQGLVKFGNYPETMFTEFEEIKKKALQATTEDEAIDFGSELLVCAEFMLPMDEEIVPVKRVIEGIGSPSSSTGI